MLIVVVVVKIMGLDQMQGMHEQLPLSYIPHWDPFVDLQIKHLHHPYHICKSIMIYFHNNVLPLIPIVLLCGW
jgi:hypothetical protein